MQARRRFPQKDTVCFLALNVVCVLTYGLLAYFLYPPYSASTLTLQLRSKASRADVYYRTTDSFETSNTVSAPVNQGRQQTLRFALPAAGIKSLRIRVSNRSGTSEIFRACLTRRDGRALCWDAQTLFAQFRGIQDIAAIRLEGTAVHVRSLGKYPLLELHPSLQENIRGFLRDSRKPMLLFWLLICGLHCLGVLFLTQLSAPTRRIQVLSKVLVTLGVPLIFYFSASSLRSLTPPFQGADEPAHFSKLLSLEQQIPCGKLPPAASALLAEYAFLIDHPERSLAQYDQPAQNPAQNSEQPGSTASINLQSACAYNSFYLLGVRMLNRMRGLSPETPGSRTFLLETRKSISQLSALLLFVLLLIVGYGKPRAFATRFEKEGEVTIARILALLFVVHIYFLPLSIWLGAVLNQDYLLLFSGTALLLALFFYIPVLNEMVAIAALSVAASKVLYLPPFALLIALGYGYSLRKKLFERARRFFAPVSLLAAILASIAAFFLFRLFLFRYCQMVNCYGIQRASLFSDPALFLTEIWEMFKQHNVLLPPPWGYANSSFAVLGWLDTWLPDSVLYQYSSTPVFLLFAGLVLYCSKGASEKKPERTDLLFALLSLGVIFIVSVLSVYFIFVLMQIWCGAQASFGCGYQRRYDLPLLPFVLSLCYFLPLSSVLRSTAASRVIVLCAVILQTVTAWESLTRSQQALAQRYKIRSEVSAPLSS